MPLLQGEKVAWDIRDHQTSSTTDWKYGSVVEELHLWVERANKDFDLGIPMPIIGIGQLRIGVLGCYRLGRNEIGARTAITINERWLPYRPFSDTIRTAIHEAVHAYDEWRLGRQRGGWYHSVGFRRKIAEIGVITDDHGHTIQVLPAFADFLKRYGVRAIGFHAPSQAGAPIKSRQMSKWVCSCESGNPVRAVHLNALCLDCNQPYRMA